MAGFGGDTLGAMSPLSYEGHSNLVPSPRGALWDAQPIGDQPPVISPKPMVSVPQPMLSRPQPSTPLSPAQACLPTLAQTLSHQPPALSPQPAVSRPEPPAPVSPALAFMPAPASAAVESPRQPWPPAHEEPSPASPQPLAPVGAAAGRSGRHAEIRSKDSAGRIVWAKLARYPWWPAQVLAEDDLFIPKDAEPPRLGAVPVRFFGTYEFSWIASQRALALLRSSQDEQASKCNFPVFLEALAEAERFMSTGELPEGFALAMQEEDVPQPKPKPKKPAKAARVKKAAAAKASAPSYGLTAVAGVSKVVGPKKGSADTPAAAVAAAAVVKKRAVHARQEKILRQLALVPPSGSPYAFQLSLAGAERLVGRVA